MYSGRSPPSDPDVTTGMIPTPRPDQVGRCTRADPPGPPSWSPARLSGSLGHRPLAAAPQRITARSTGNGRPGGSVLRPMTVDRVLDLGDEPVRGCLRSRTARRTARRGSGGRRRGEREPHDLAGLPVRPHAPRLAHCGDHREPTPTGGRRGDLVDVAHHRKPGIVVVHRDHELVQQQLDLDDARLVGLGMSVDVGEELCHTERGPVYQRIQMPVAQLRRYDSADLADPRRQGLSSTVQCLLG